MLLIRGAEVVLPEGVTNVDVLIDGAKIVRIGTGIVADAEVIDGRGLVAGPGFVDVHVHGGGGHSFFAGDADAVRRYAAWAPRNGVTSFLVSTLGRDADATVELLSALAPVLGAAGAEPLGFHLEGPFLNPVRKGAFPARMLRVPSVSEFARFQDAAAGAIHQVTIAPELPGALEVVEAIAASGAVASMGHTDATVAEARAGFDRGITHVTHLFNAMRPIHQREGGPAVAALLDARVTCELICDGAHVSEDVLAFAFHTLGRERVVVATDNLELAGTPGGSVAFAGSEVRTSGDVAVRDDGTIVGSTATYDRHFRRALRLFAGDLGAAFRVCATNPANVAGAGGRKGSIAVGNDADIVLLDDAHNVVMTVCRGEIAFRA